MDKCEWCNLTEKDKEWLLFETQNWSVYLADIQDYIGRCILVSKRHCGSLSQLTLTEWVDLKEIINRLEQCYTQTLGANVCNWSCLLNDFFKKDRPNPHMHIHVRPRYKHTIKINHNTYEDSEFAHHYALGKVTQLKDGDRITLYRIMKNSLT